MDISNLIITGDILRAWDSYMYPGDRTIKKTECLFKTPLESATGIKAKAVYARDKTFFDVHRFYRLSGYHIVNQKNWLQIDTGHYSDASLAYFYDCFKDSVLILQEAGSVRKFVERLALPYVEISISSLRFTEDLHYAFRSNVDSIREKLLSYRLSEAYLYANADRIRLFYSNKSEITGLAPGSLLCCGQSLVDYSLIRDGRLVSFLDYQQEVSQLFGQYAHVYYKRHPYGLIQEKTEGFLLSHGNVQKINENFYELMCQSSIAAVAALSSSVLNEAGYFGKTVHTLFQRYSKHYDGAAPAQKDEWITLRSDYFSPLFWADVLGSILEVRPSAHTGFRGPVIRQVTGMNWGYALGSEDAQTLPGVLTRIQAMERTYGELRADYACMQAPSERAGRPPLRYRLGVGEDIRRLTRGVTALLAPIMAPIARLFCKVFPIYSKRHQFLMERNPFLYLKRLFFKLAS